VNRQVVLATPAGTVEELRRTARSVLASTVRPTHWIVAGSEVGHERVTRARNLRRSAIVVARDDLPIDDGAIVVFMDSGTALDPAAIATIAAALPPGSPHRGAYGDSTHRAEGRLAAPVEVRRPQWSPERLRSHCYVGDLVAVEGRVASAAGGAAALARMHPHDRALRLAEAAGSLARIPEILSHRHDTDTAPPASVGAVEGHCTRTGIDAECTADPSVAAVRVARRIRRRPTISAIMPTRGTVGSVRGREVVLGAHAIASLPTAAEAPDLQIVAVFDHDTPRGARDAIRAAAGSRLVEVEWEQPFNFAEKVNLGVLESDGELLLLLNDDTEMVSPDALDVLAGILEDPGVAAAGPMLLYEDGLIQSAGHLLNPIPYDLYRTCDPAHVGAQNLLRVQREVSGVIAAFAMVRRSAFLEAGGLCPALPLNYNDVDFCLKLQHLGHRVVWTPHARVHHFESRTRDPSLQPFEMELLGARWRDRLDDDPYFNPRLERYVSTWKPDRFGQDAVSEALGPTAPIASK